MTFDPEQVERVCPDSQADPGIAWVRASDFDAAVAEIERWQNEASDWQTTAEAGRDEIARLRQGIEGLARFCEDAVEYWLAEQLRALLESDEGEARNE